MTSFLKNLSAYQCDINSHYATSELSFDDRVLQFIRDTKPEGTLAELINKIQSLDTDHKYSSQQLINALLYTDSTLRGDPNFQDYTTETLDRNTSQMLGVNMLINNMMNRAFLSPYDKESDYS
ncbi:type III secretion system protein [Erwinia amylovora]|uniref:type III secretion system protein n=1 Tax=Erwinia amylovora TaxID=552 RepID=UPI001443CD43|nr:type III secretion system protein [Erwinia amylovora]